ncbi:MAG TPA: di-heme oxidoredictase family protein, partial [Thermoanaerobaculia bacterium]|nr:di-heme oxidoredictase family protein [Thermoanaerobaculia bacterium]
VVGGSGQRTNTRFGHIANGQFDPLARFGGQLMHGRAIGPADGSPHQFRPEAVPAGANVIALRRPSPLFGLGLVDATPDATFVALAAQQAARRDGTAGRVSMVDNHAAGMQTVGKFGWKADVPSLLQFAGDAYLNELGVTSPAFPDEICPGGRCSELRFNPAPGLNATSGEVQALVDFMSMLAPAPRGKITPDVRAGEIVFNRIGCHSCHVSTLQSGPHPNPALDRVTYHPYSDFLLHDMGFLGDGIEQQGTATGREFRTAPLWGLRMRTRYLHDGSALTLTVAIEAHDGQGRASRDQFKRLSAADRANLLAFLESL